MSSWRGRLALTAVALAAAVPPLSYFVYVPFTGDALAVHDQALVFGRLRLCGRIYTNHGQPPMSATKIESMAVSAPAIVDPRLFAPCPPGPCTATAAVEPCDTVIFVRVGEDAYLDYELSGGP